LGVIVGFPWPELEALIRRDPGGRGVASFCVEGRPLAENQLRRAAESLAEHGQRVAVVTGFCVFDGERWTAETDGPPGALYLARALICLGLEVSVLGDAYCTPLLQAGCDAWGLPPGIVHEFPFEPGGPEAPNRQSNDPLASPTSLAWAADFLASAAGKRLSHVVAIERCGPSHTLTSLEKQPRDGPVPYDEFESEVPPDHRNRCHNMRGVDITAHTAKTHLLFEKAREAGVHTIGLADGGNELGMGSVAWETLRQAIRQGPAGRVACRIAADDVLLAGVSNWAGYALASAVCVLRGRRDLLAPWDAADLKKLIQAMVDHGGAVDGVTRRHEASVDGLPLEDYLAVLTAMRSLANVD
jgi:hypothetical protein